MGTGTFARRSSRVPGSCRQQWTLHVSDQRADTLNEVARHLGTLLSGHPLRVGIDGVCGAGKSAFARDLAVALEAIGRSVIHIDSDGFHHIRERRYRQGRDSARGYYDDAYDFDSLTERVLLPLGPAGSREYAVRVHDLTTDAVIDTETAQAPSGAVVIFDATFIQRDTLRELWDEVIYLHSTVEAAMARGIARDAASLGGNESARAAYESRYMAACLIYVDEQKPRERASIVIDHTDPRAPTVERIG